MLRDWLIVDIETAGRDECRRFVKPDARLTDEKKIAASIDERCERLALDPNGSRIVSLGMWSSLSPEPGVMLCQNEEAERSALSVFWLHWATLPARSRRLVGFNVLEFDARILIRRSQLLDVAAGYLSLARYGKGDVLDLYQELCFHDTYQSGVVPRSLDVFCQQFGIDVPDEIDGAEIPELVAAGEWDKVAAHNLADVKRTRALALRLGLIAAGQPVVQTREIAEVF